MLCGTAARRVLTDYADVIGEVLPEILPSVGFVQRHPCHIYTVYEHCLAALEHIPPEPVLRWTALLHDLGKPDCCTADDDGTHHYYGHADRSAVLAAAALTRLKFDTASRERILRLVSVHDRPIEPTVPAVKRALWKLTPEVFSQLIAVKRADNFAQAGHLRDRQKYYDELERIAAEILAARDCFSLRDLAVSGDDLMALGVPKGPAVGAALKSLLGAVIDGAVPNEKSALLSFLAAKEGE